MCQSCGAEFVMVPLDTILRRSCSVLLRINDPGRVGGVPIHRIRSERLADEQRALWQVIRSGWLSPGCHKDAEGTAMTRRNAPSCRRWNSISAIPIPRQRQYCACWMRHHSRSLDDQDGGRMMISTRRLLARPSAVSFGAIGRVAPCPSTVSRAGATPPAISVFATPPARCSDSV